MASHLQRFSELSWLDNQSSPRASQQMEHSWDTSSCHWLSHNRGSKSKYPLWTYIHQPYRTSELALETLWITCPMLSRCPTTYLHFAQVWDIYWTTLEVSYDSIFLRDLAPQCLGCISSECVVASCLPIPCLMWCFRSSLQVTWWMYYLLADMSIQTKIINIL